MTQNEIKERTRSALARALKVAPESIGDSASQIDLADWDSVRHMNVILALENDFNIEFDDAELPKLTSFPALVAAVERHTST